MKRTTTRVLNEYRKRQQLPWMRDVRPGDVLLSGAGTQRVVRRVSRTPNGDLYALTFAIRHCSWTKRPYTVLTFTDLVLQGYRPAGVRVQLRSKLDARLDRAIDHSPERSPLTCCTVAGVA